MGQTVDISSLGALFGSVDSITILISFAFFFGIMMIGLKKKEGPIYLAMANFIMLFTLFVAQGIASSIFAYVIIFICSYLLTKVVGDLFLGQTGETKTMISYIMFLGVTLFFLNYANLTSSVFSGNLQTLSSPSCDLSLDLLILGKIAWCGVSYISYFTNLMVFNSSIGIVNISLFVPFGYFVVKFMADWLRGRGGS